MSELFQSGFRLGECTVDPVHGQIQRPDGTDHVSPKAMEILLCLVARHEELVERDTLIEAGWGGGEHHEEALTRCIAELRQALGDHHEYATFIQTIPRRGYRLVAPLHIQGNASTNGSSASGGDSASPDFWAELNRRGVVRTALAYAALAWLTIEVMSVVGGIFELPTGTLRALVVMAVVGFPIVISLSWAVQKTPTGLALDMPVAEGTRATSPTTARKIDMVIIVTLLVAVSILIYREFRPPDSLQVPEKSIAVLPFDNLSDNVNDEYIGDGLAEEVLNLLAQTEDLDVTSRKASFYYKNKDVPLTEIISALGVRNIIEGSVQRSGERLRVTVQLVDGFSLMHRWSKTYDIEEPDLLSVRDTVARRIASELETLMTDRGEQMMRRDAATEGTAFLLYLQARAELRKEHHDDSLSRAERFLHRAIDIDDKFAKAHAALCDTNLAWFVQSGRELEFFEKAERACYKALALNDDMTEVYVALGNLYRESGMVAEAIREFEHALELESDRYDAVYGIAQTLEAQGDLEAAESNYRELTALEPGYWHGYNALGHFFYGSSRFAEASYNFDRATKLAPDNALTFNNLGAAAYMRGDYPGAAAAWELSQEIRPSNLVLSNIGLAAYYAGEFGKASRMQQQAIVEAPEDFRIWGRLGDAQRQLGNATEALDAYGNAMRFASRAAELNPDSEETLRYLSLYYSHTGSSDAAILTIERAREISPDSARVHYFASKVYLGAGDRSRAVKELEDALALGYSIAIATADPDLAALRQNGQLDLPRSELQSESL